MFKSKVFCFKLMRYTFQMTRYTFEMTRYTVEMTRYTFKVTRYPFEVSIGLRFRKQRLPLRRISPPRVSPRLKHGGNTSMSRCKRNTSRMCPEHSKLHFWLGNGYVKIILTWGKMYFCHRVIISKSGSIVYIRRLCRFECLLTRCAPTAIIPKEFCCSWMG